MDMEKIVCENFITISHADSREINRAKMAMLDGSFFTEFAPCPDTLVHTGISVPDSDMMNDIEHHNFALHGSYNAVEWCRNNWGTIGEGYDYSDIEEHYTSVSGTPFGTHYEPLYGTLTAVFYTIGGSPLAFLGKLREQGFTVESIYAMDDDLVYKCETDGNVGIFNYS